MKTLRAWRKRLGFKALLVAAVIVLLFQIRSDSEALRSAGLDFQPDQAKRLELLSR